MGRSFLIVSHRSPGQPPAVGITITNNVLVMVSVRDQPLRITGIYRQDLSEPPSPPAAHDRRLRKALRRGRRALGLPRRARATVALHPQETNIGLRLDQTMGDAVTVRCRPTLPRLLEQAGFESDSFDLLPASIARVALCGCDPTVAVRHRSGWSVQVTPDRLDAHWSRNTASDNFAVGSKLTDTAEARRVAGLGVPQELQTILHLGLDAGALGAALGAVGLSPTVEREWRPKEIDLRSVDALPSPAIG